MRNFVLKQPLIERTSWLESARRNEQLIVWEILRQEADGFARNNDDVGCVANLELDIQLKGKKAVQRNYISIAKPLYEELKGYSEDLINQNWMCKSPSAYFSSMVRVREKKKMGACNCVLAIKN